LSWCLTTEEGLLFRLRQKSHRVLGEQIVEASHG
jgi:hypothetical protein